MDAFADHYFTRDRRHLLIGGFCEDGTVTKCKNMLSALSAVFCTSSTDCVMVDAWLSRQIVSMVPPEMKLLAATIQVPGCPLPCGGVFGDPHEIEGSANASLSFHHSMYAFALPGSVGVSLRCSQEDAVFLYKRARSLFSSGHANYHSLMDFSSDIARRSNEYLMISDGSGGSTGCLMLRGKNYSTSLWL